MESTDKVTPKEDLVHAETPIETPGPTWEGHVKQELSALMNTFLPISEQGNLGIVYRKAVKEQLESGAVYEENLVEGVEIVISLDFSQPVERPIK